MEEREPISFDPVEMRARLAASDEYFAEFLRFPLYADEAKGRSDGWPEKLASVMQLLGEIELR